MSIAKQNVLRTLLRFLGKDFSLHRRAFLTLCKETVRQVTALILVFSSVFFLCAHQHVEKVDADDMLKYQVPQKERTRR